MVFDNYLALDIGEKRIGLAIGSFIPFSRGVLPGENIEQALDQLKSLVQEEGITAFVVGLPVVKSGDKTENYQRAETWVARLEETFHLPVYTVDEAYTSTQAEQQLRDAGVDTAKEKGKIDEQSAILILEQFFREQS